MARRLILALVLDFGLRLYGAGGKYPAGCRVLPLGQEHEHGRPSHFPAKNDYCPVIKLAKEKPATVFLDIKEKVNNAFFYELKLGGRSFCLMVARVSTGTVGAGAIGTTSSTTTTTGSTTTTTTGTFTINAGKGFNAVYFDADADGKITSDERLKTETFEKPVAGLAANNIIYTWITRPYDRLCLDLPYTRADGTAGTQTLTFALEMYAFYEDVSFSGTKDPDKLMEALMKMLNPQCYARIYLETWFVGEVAAGGDRVLKAAVVDGNQNGLFNEAKEDFLLIDANCDGLFDWNKERKPLGKTLSGLGAEGKKSQLTPAVAAWPRRLWLAPKEAAPSPAQLETE